MRMWGYRPLNMGCTRDGFGFGERLLMGLFWLLSFSTFSFCFGHYLCDASRARKGYPCSQIPWELSMVPWCSPFSAWDFVFLSSVGVFEPPNPWSCSQHCPWFPHPCPLCRNTYFFFAVTDLSLRLLPLSAGVIGYGLLCLVCLSLLAPTCRANLLEGFFTMSGIPWWLTGSFVILAQELKLSSAFINTQSSIFWSPWVNSE